MFANTNQDIQRPSAQAKLLLTVAEAASVLGISRSILYELLLKGEIRSIKIGRSRRIPFVALEEFVAVCLEQPRQLDTKR